MRKPQYSLVIGLLCIFYVLGLIRIKFEKYIPALPPNKLANRPGSFLKSAVHQPIDWQPSPSDAVERASALDRPILLVLGSAESKVGALMDKRVFSDWTVVTEINNRFVPVRIDLDEHPEWRAALFPISRMNMPFLPDYQIFSLDENARIEHFFEPPTSQLAINPTAFMEALIAARQEYDAGISPKEVPSAQQIQSLDLAELGQPVGPAFPDFKQYAAALSKSLDPNEGVFEENSFLRVHPEAWLCLSRISGTASARESLDRYLFSPAMDVLRGGFFIIEESPSDPPLDVNFSEDTVQNARLSDLLAELGLIDHNSFYTTVGKRTFDMIMRDLVENGLLVTQRPSDGDLETNRSLSASISRDQVDKWLSPSEAAYVTQNLSLGQNRQGIPFVSNQTAIISPSFEDICHKIREKQVLPIAPDPVQYLYVNGNALADLCRCARLWNDPERLRQVREGIGQLERFHSGSELSHTPEPAEESLFVGDYLAFSSAELQFYLTTGETDHFIEGRQALTTCIERFLDPHRHTLNTFDLETPSALNRDFNNPELADGDLESTTAQAIRLASTYAKLLGPAGQGRFLERFAHEQVAKYSRISVANSPALAGYYLAALDLSDPLTVLTVGPHSVSDANQLARSFPDRVVSSVGRSVRPGLRRRKSGVYLSNEDKLSGPYTLAQAVSLIPRLTVPTGAN